MTRHLILFAKPPRIGLAKTRLAKTLGPAEARRIATALMARTLRQVRDPRWTLHLRITPDHAVDDTLGGLWPCDLPRAPQGSGDLGERLTRAVREAPGRQVVVIGTDTPDLTRATIWRAFRALDRTPAVVGPARDGGFYLIGLQGRLRRAPPFHGVRWSSPQTLSDVLSRLADGTAVTHMPPLQDIDVAADWRAWNAGRFKTASTA